jgi:hypothetical protein
LKNLKIAPVLYLPLQKLLHQNSRQTPAKNPTTRAGKKAGKKNPITASSSYRLFQTLLSGKTIQIRWVVDIFLLLFLPLLLLLLLKRLDIHMPKIIELYLLK